MFTIANGVILKGVSLTPVKENIVIDDGRILEIGENILEGKIIDASGCIVCPSFLNAHTHIGDSIIRDEGYGLSLEEMVKPPNGVKHKALSQVDDEDLIDSMKESMWEMFESGTTHFIDYREGGIEGVKLLKKASEEIPITPIILGRDDSFYGADPDLKKVKIAIRKLLKIADGIAPSGFGEISDEVANLIVEECNKQGKISSIHVAESEEVQNNSLAKFKKSEIERGLNSNFTQLVHCTNLVKNDLELLKNNVNNITLCPRANVTLSVGVPHLNKLLDLKLKPLIGTDNVMLNSPVMFRELEFTLKLMSYYYKSYINPLDLLQMATSNILNFTINDSINKSVISEGCAAELFIAKQLSKNPYLNIINRCESKTILYIINKNITHIIG